MKSSKYRLRSIGVLGAISRRVILTSVWCRRHRVSVSPFAAPHCCVCTLCILQDSVASNTERDVAINHTRGRIQSGLLITCVTYLTVMSLLSQMKILVPFSVWLWGSHVIMHRSAWHKAWVIFIQSDCMLFICILFIPHSILWDRHSLSILQRRNQRGSVTCECYRVSEQLRWASNLGPQPAQAWAAIMVPLWGKSSADHSFYPPSVSRRRLRDSGSERYNFF